MQKEIILAIIQGLTEFLPVSSSGHLALFGNYFDVVDVGYFTLLHVASLFAILIYTRHDIKRVLTNPKENTSLLFYIIIGIIPAAFVGFFFKDFIEQTFTIVSLLGFSFMITGVIVMSSYFFTHTKGILNTKRSFIIGLAQILALFPGISRSGTTISFGLFSGLQKKEAFRYSFLMAIPLILGATLLEFHVSLINLSMIIGFIVCFCTSLLGLFILDKMLQKNYFWVFGIYCFVLGAAVVITNLY